MAHEIATTGPSLVAKFGAKFGVDPGKLLETLKSTCFRQRSVNITNEQMMALLIVADQYSLNPFTKEIFAFEDKGHIIPVVSVDGWIRIINEHPQMDGIEFRYSEKPETMPKGKPCPEWCEVVISRRDRSSPIVVREYLDEVYVGPRGQQGINGPWQSHTKRMLRWKTLIQGARVAFGFAGIYDEDEAHRIIETAAQPTATPVTQDKSELSAKLRAIGQEQAVIVPTIIPEVAEEIRDFDPDTGELLPEPREEELP